MEVDHGTWPPLDHTTALPSSISGSRQRRLGLTLHSFRAFRFSGLGLGRSIIFEVAYSKAVSITAKCDWRWKCDIDWASARLLKPDDRNSSVSWFASGRSIARRSCSVRSNCRLVRRRPRTRPTFEKVSLWKSVIQSAVICAKSCDSAGSGWSASAGGISWRVIRSITRDHLANDAELSRSCSNAARSKPPAPSGPSWQSMQWLWRKLLARSGIGDAAIERNARHRIRLIGTRRKNIDSSTLLVQAVWNGGTC